MKSKVLDMINDQLNFEIESAHIYLAMAGYAAELDLEGFQNFFMVQYEEELFHAKKLMDYIIERGGRVNIKGFENPVNEYASIQEAFEVAYGHEQLVTGRINAIAAAAKDANDFATSSFIQWFIDEQVEEESTFSGIIAKIKFLDNSGLYLLDKDLAARTFVPPVQ